MPKILKSVAHFEFDDFERLMSGLDALTGRNQPRFFALFNAAPKTEHHFKGELKTHDDPSVSSSATVCGRDATSRGVC